MKKAEKQALHRLLDRIVNRNGEIESLRKYYQEQGLTNEKLHKDLWQQVPPLDRQRLPMVTDRDVADYFNALYLPIQNLGKTKLNISGKILDAEIVRNEGGNLEVKIKDLEKHFPNGICTDVLNDEVTFYKFKQ